MTSTEAQTMIKSSLGDYLSSDSNKVVWAFSKQISAQFNKEVKDMVSKRADTSEADIINVKLQELMDKPMSEEQESKALRAIYQLQLSTGELSPQLLDKMDKIIGVGTGKDEVIQTVDFSDAFPDYADAIECCHKPQPKICKCGGVK